MTPLNHSRYRILRKVGEGGMGDVYLAHDQRLNRYIALKFLPDRFVSDPHRLARFRQEAQLASAINHPNVITIHDMDEEGDLHYLVTEYVDGVNLRERMNEGPISVGEAIRIAIEVGQALAAAHEFWVLHRDVKPENIMIRSDGWVKVLDFGLAKLLEEDPSSEGPARAETAPGTVPGTLAYTAPERLAGEVADPRSDIFSLGCVLYEMVAGAPPFQGAGLSAVVESLMRDEPTSLDRVRDDTPELLDPVVARMLSKDPAHRYQRACEALTDLGRIRRRMSIL